MARGSGQYQLIRPFSSDIGKIPCEYADNKCDTVKLFFKLVKLLTRYLRNTTSSKGTLNRGPHIPSSVANPTDIIILISAP